MSPWQALYLKELQDNRNLFLFLLAVTLGLDLYSYFHGASDGRPSPALVLALLPYASVFVLPFILVYAFSQEFKAQTHYQLLALPVSRAGIVVGKFLAVLTAGVAVFVLATGTVHLLFLSLRGMTPPGFQGGDLWLIVGCCYFSSLLLLLGIASAMAGLKLVVRRFQGLFKTVFLVASLYLYGRALASFLEPLDRLFHHEAAGIHSLLPVFLLTALFSLLLLGLSVALFERFAEA
jgi:ABC-type transport system involved in multi-copper enzyme maturation permease subunit